MQLSPELIRQFQALHLEKYGEVASYETAEQSLIELARLVRIAYSRKESDQSD